MDINKLLPIYFMIKLVQTRICLLPETLLLNQSDLISRSLTSINTTKETTSTR